MDGGGFLGTLLGISQVPANDRGHSDLRRAGNVLLAECARSKKKGGRKKKVAHITVGVEPVPVLDGPRHRTISRVQAYRP